MIRIETEIEGRSHTVDVESADGGLRVVVDGRERLVDVRAFDGFFYSLLIGCRSYEVTVEENEDGFRVQVGTEAVQVQRLDPLRPARQGSGGGRGAPTRILSVMPGKVVRVLVKTGDEIREGQPLVVVEAMKMENEMLSPRPGRVAQVRVAPGSTVEGGAELLVLE